MAERIKAAIKSPEILELVNICVINALGYKSKISSKTVDNAIDSIVSFVHSEIDSSNLSDNDKEKEKNSYKHFANIIRKTTRTNFQNEAVRYFYSLPKRSGSFWYKLQWH